MKHQMLRIGLVGLFAAAMLPVATAQEKRPTSAQAQRGFDLFQKSPKGIACGTCHSLAETGTAVGPDLRKMASVLTPRGLVKVIEMEMTENVQSVKTKAGTFPGIQKEKQGDNFEIWDLSQTPPVLRKLTSKEIVSMTRDEHWKHPPTSAGYTSQELADIISFLKWASTGSQAVIKSSDIESQ
jgi:hypothetical protein